MNKNLLTIGFLTFLVLLTSCAQTQQASGEAVHTQHSLQKESRMLFQKDDPDVKVIRMTATNFQFEPSLIEVKKGDKVRILAKSLDVDHGIHLDLNDASIELPPNEERVIDFIADKAGTFEFHCSVFCGSGHGRMKGKLIVKE